MKLSTSATAAILAALAFVQGATAVDFDFREFEGWWEGADVTRGRPVDPVNPSGLGTYGSILSPNDLNANFKCEATGDFRKAMCEYTWVVQSDQPCFLAAAGALPNRNPNHNTGIVKCQFMLDQFDADTGKVDELMCDVECCGFDGCSPYPWPLVTVQWNQVQPLVEPSLQQVPPNVNAFGPQLLVNLSMEAGKSNNHVKAIKVKQRPMVTEAGQEYIPDRVEPFSPDHYLRRTAGGFKEL